MADLYIRHGIRKLWPVILGLVICLYFGYHAFTGERGVGRLIEIKKELNHAKEIESKTSAEREFWQAKVRPLSPNSLDLDKVDEMARKVLNMANPQDRVVTNINE